MHLIDFYWAHHHLIATCSHSHLLFAVPRCGWWTRLKNAITVSSTALTAIYEWCALNTGRTIWSCVTNATATWIVRFDFHVSNAITRSVGSDRRCRGPVNDR